MLQAAQLHVDHLTKRYRSGTLALHELTFQASTGLIGLLGPNGAGKTTLMRILSTIQRPTSGTFWWGPHDVVREPNVFRQTLGYLPQDFAAPSMCSAYQVVERLAAIKGLQGSERKKRIVETLEIVGLQREVDRKVGTFSGGMLRRLGIAQAIVHQPEVIIVDEPTAGLDPEERVRFRTLLASLAHDRLVLLSTHIVADIEAIAERIVVLIKGSLVNDSPADVLINRAKGSVWLATISASEFQSVQRDPSYRIVTATQRAEGVIIRLLSQTPPPWPNVQLEEPTLEDAYLFLMSEHGGEAA